MIDQQTERAVSQLVTVSQHSLLRQARVLSPAGTRSTQYSWTGQMGWMVGMYLASVTVMAAVSYGGRRLIKMLLHLW